MKELEKIKELVKKMKEEGSFEDCLQMKELDSYYDKECETQYLQTLEMETPIQLLNYLYGMWGHSREVEELSKLIVVAAFKMRGEKKVKKDKIKDRIYNF